MDLLQVSRDDFGDFQVHATSKQSNFTHDCMAFYLKKTNTPLSYFIRFLLFTLLYIKRNELKNVEKKPFMQAALLIVGLISYFKKFFQSVLEVKWDKVQFHGSYPDKNKHTEASIPI